MNDEHFGENNTPHRDRSETEHQIGELQAEHDHLNVEWADLQRQAMDAYETLKAAFAGPMSDEMLKEADTIDMKLRTLHARQHEILDRQSEIEQQIVRRLR